MDRNGKLYLPHSLHSPIFETPLLNADKNFLPQQYCYLMSFNMDLKFESAKTQCRYEKWESGKNRGTKGSEDHAEYTFLKNKISSFSLSLNILKLFLP